MTKALFVTQCHAIVGISELYHTVSLLGNTTPIQLKHSYYGEQELMTLQKPLTLIIQHPLFALKEPLVWEGGAYMGVPVLKK